MSLTGVRILITRRHEQAAGMADEITRRGGTPLVHPMIRIAPPLSWDECDTIVARLHEYHAVVFPSANAVSQFLGRCASAGAGIPGDVAIYAVGENTAGAIRAGGYVPRDIPETFSASGLLDVLMTDQSAGKRFLLPHGDRAREELASGLRERGAAVDEVCVYRTCGPDDADVRAVADLLAAGKIDVITFASPSAATNFFQHIPRLLSLLPLPPIAVIGPTTRDAVLSCGATPAIIAATATARGIVDALTSWHTTTHFTQ